MIFIFSIIAQPGKPFKNEEEKDSFKKALFPCGRGLSHHQLNQCALLWTVGGVQQTMYHVL